MADFTSEFRIINGHIDKDIFLGRFVLPVVFNPGELVNIDGNPYVVHTRDWALSSEAEGIPANAYVYYRVARAWVPRGEYAVE